MKVLKNNVKYLYQKHSTDYNIDLVYITIAFECETEYSGTRIKRVNLEGQWHDNRVIALKIPTSLYLDGTFSNKYPEDKAIFDLYIKFCAKNDDIVSNIPCSLKRFEIFLNRTFKVVDKYYNRETFNFNVKD